VGLIGLDGYGMAEQSGQTLIEIPLQNLGIGLGPAHIQVVEVAAASDIMRTRKPTGIPIGCCVEKRFLRQ